MNFNLYHLDLLATFLGSLLQRRNSFVGRVFSLSPSVSRKCCQLLALLWIQNYCSEQDLSPTNY
jgi:hypothetical protein